MTIVAAINLDGEEQQNSNLELAVFDVASGECRATKYPGKLHGSGHYFYRLTVKGVTGESYTFKVYDHSSEEEWGYEIVFTDDHPQPTFVQQTTIGANGNPYPVNFVSGGGFEKEIYAYEPEDHWYLISSPVGTVAVESVGNILEPGSFDLYYFDEGAPAGDDGKTLEWINYDQGTSDPGFSQLEAGKGYLYASSDTITLVFNGAANAESVSVDLAKTTGAEFEGWNLVGNPYGVVAYIDRAFYRMNESNTEIMGETSTGAINVMEGVFVMAASDGEAMAFTTTAPDVANPSLALNVSRDSKVVDRAVVSFGSERTLPKFQLNPSHTKVYIPQENSDYAVVTAGEMGEMPVCFKAERNGRYTLDFTAQAVTFAYLHLIDNKTGKDVDLLESPAYSFDAQTTDYASRFKLVFATGNATDDSFAFCSNGNWIISNDGEATLQVIDVTGRILSSETVSGCVSKAISAAPGVYMLRLINGDNMKVQKVVVK